MSRYTHFTKQKHLIFLNGGSTYPAVFSGPPSYLLAGDCIMFVSDRGTRAGVELPSPCPAARGRRLCLCHTRVDSGPKQLRGYGYIGNPASAAAANNLGK
jgi:hypothetical protein